MKLARQRLEVRVAGCYDDVVERVFGIRSEAGGCSTCKPPYRREKAGSGEHALGELKSRNLWRCGPRRDAAAEMEALDDDREHILGLPGHNTT